MEFTGSWKQYSRSEFTGIFLSVSYYIQSETMGKLSGKSSYFPFGTVFVEHAGYDHFLQGY
jgi:hypothetical protein